MFNSKLIKILKDEVKLKEELIVLQNSLIEKLFEENNKLLEIFNNITKKENTTENNVFLDSRNKSGNLSVKGDVVVEGKTECFEQTQHCSKCGQQSPKTFKSRTNVFEVSYCSNCGNKF